MLRAGLERGGRIGLPQEREEQSLPVIPGGHAQVEEESRVAKFEQDCWAWAWA